MFEVLSSLLTRAHFLDTTRSAPNLTENLVHSVEARGFHFTEVAYKPGAKLPPHSHQTASVYFLTSGSVSEQVGAASAGRRAGDLVFTPAGEAHSVLFEAGGGRCLVIELEMPLDGRVLDGRKLPTYPVHHRGSAQMAGRRLYAEFRLGRAPLILESIAYELLADLLRQPDVTARVELHVDRARDFLVSHSSGSISLADVAKAVDLHPIYLARAFRQKYGCSVGEYLLRCRIEHACRRLASSNCRLVDIALDNGFCDQAHFTRTFRRFLGLTPTEYRSACRPVPSGDS